MDAHPSPIDNAAVLQHCQDLKIPFLSSYAITSNPREEHCAYFVRTMLLPTYKMLSLTTFLCITYAVLFVIGCALGFHKQGQFLEIRSETLVMLQCNQPLLVYRGQVYRPMVSIFLSQTFYQMAVSIGCTLVVVSRFQHSFGWWRTAFAFVITGIIGNFFFGSISRDPYNDISCGAYTSLLGLVGTFFGYLVINCDALRLLLPPHKKRLILGFVEVVGAGLVSMLGETHVDPAGFIFSVLGGIWAAGILPSINDQPRHKMMKRVCLGLLALQTLATVVIFMFSHPVLRETDRHW